jgi:coenzyme Q-binding protein COQ10
MPTHAEQRFLPYSPAQLFALVSDVESYPQFLPWCLLCRISHRENNIVYADLIIGYKMIREKFGSKVTLNEPHSIHVEYLHGPMKYLSNHWKFIEAEQGGCIVDFYVDFEFRNPILQKMMGAFFNEIVRRMVSAFEMRAKVLYG